jgi:hypothetical protein
MMFKVGNADGDTSEYDNIKDALAEVARLVQSPRNNGIYMDGPGGHLFGASLGRKAAENGLTIPAWWV